MGTKEYLKRIVLWPFMTLFRLCRRIMFQFSDDSKFLKTLKNSHEGERCFILGNGPSLTIEDLDLLKDEFTFGSNRVYKLFDKTSWRPTIYMAVDNDVIKAEHENMEAAKLPCKLINVTSKAYANFSSDVHYFNMYGPYVIRQYKYEKKGISKDPSISFSMSYSVVCLQIELAIYMGFKEIYILGCDHNYSHYVNKDGKFIIDDKIQDYGYGIKRLNFTMQFKDATTSCFQAYQDFAVVNGIKIENLTRGGKLEVFPRNNIENII